MSRYVSVLLLFASLAALVGAQGSAGLPSPKEQADLLSRDRQLVRAAIENSLELTSQTGYLDRAKTCNRLVKVWAHEIEDAARAKDQPRTSEMVGLLNRVVESGVVKNLQSARQKIQEGSPMERELFLRRDEALDALRPLEELIRNAGRELESVAASLSQGRRSVESAADLHPKPAK
jgi:hypothetical protein